jgi:hypothetical protein
MHLPLRVSLSAEKLVVLCALAVLLSAYPALADSPSGTASLVPADTARTRVIIDSDANNELDDQHAIAYALLSGNAFQVEGITINRTDTGGDIGAHTEEAHRVVRLVGLDGAVPIREGASGAYETIVPQIDAPDFDGAAAVNFLIERAHAPDERPLVIVAIGKLTNVALALAKDPSIASEIRIVWLGSNFPAPGEWNLENDTSAVNPVIESDAPFEVAVVRYGRSSGTTAVRTFQPEIRARMPGLGPEVDVPVTGRHGGSHRTFGDYSVALFDHVDDRSRALYDVAALAIVKNPAWGVRKSVGPYRLDDGEWVRQTSGDDLVIWELFYTSKILDDFFSILADPTPAVSP